jgi:hypothetical protein
VKTGSLDLGIREGQVEEMALEVSFKEWAGFQRDSQSCSSSGR